LLNLGGLDTCQHLAVGAVAMLVKAAKNALLEFECEPGTFESLKSMGSILQTAKRRDGDTLELAKPLSKVESPADLVADNPIICHQAKPIDLRHAVAHVHDATSHAFTRRGRVAPAGFVFTE
jgi:hypothetical protein